MRYRKLTRRLTELGCTLERRGKGSHTLWRNTNTGKRAAIPDWGGKDLRPGTVRGIIKQLGISRKEFGPLR